MAGNLVSGPVKPHDGVVRQAVPVVRGTIDQAAGEIERTAAAMLLQKPGALACGAIGGIVEGEAHHGCMRGQPVRRGAEMPGQPIAHASLECRPHDLHFLSVPPLTEAFVRCSRQASHFVSPNVEPVVPT